MSNWYDLDEDQIEDEESSICPTCHNENHGRLGVLGRLIWVNCRYCGIQYNLPTEDE